MRGNGILLLGGGGFIGSVLRRRLASQGQHVHVITRTSGLGLINEPGITVHAGDLGNRALLEELLPLCDKVVHLASATKPGTSGRHPALEIENLTSTLQLLEVLENWPDTRLIYLSSGGTVYGNPAQIPVQESTTLSPLSYHGAGKMAAEAFLNAFRIAGHPVTILRPSNAYGPDQKLNLGFGLVRTILQHILDGSTLEIWGDGESVRDFIYVDDIVQAIEAVLNAPPRSVTYNVGSGIGYSLNQVLAIAKNVCGEPLDVIYRPARSMDVRAVVLDISRIASELDWRPAVTLEDGIRRTWHWLKDHG
nr:NAD-dependent epimerase/dehydratase family protein [Janthinobacterium sp. 17J80-10]